MQLDKFEIGQIYGPYKTKTDCAIKFGIDKSSLDNFIRKGFIKGDKKKDGWYFVRLYQQPEQKQSRKKGDLKEALTAVQIKKIQQQLEDGKRKIIDEFKSDVKQGIIEILIDLKSTIAKLKLKEKQLEKLNKCVNQSIKKLNL